MEFLGESSLFVFRAASVLQRSPEKMRLIRCLFLAFLFLGGSASGSEAHPTLGWVQWSRIHSTSEIFTAKVEKVDQRVLYKNKVVKEGLDELEKRLLKLLEAEGEALKEFVDSSSVVTVIELKITKSHSGDKKVGDKIELVLTDTLGDLCKHFMQLPISGDFVDSEHVWAISPEEGPLGTTVEKVYWTTRELWREIMD